jgi:hypothetical protein
MNIDTGEGPLSVAATCLIGIIIPAVWGLCLWRDALANFDRLIGRPCKTAKLASGGWASLRSVGPFPDLGGIRTGQEPNSSGECGWEPHNESDHIMSHDAGKEFPSRSIHRPDTIRQPRCAHRSDNTEVE